MKRSTTVISLVLVGGVVVLLLSTCESCEGDGSSRPGYPGYYPRGWYGGSGFWGGGSRGVFRGSEGAAVGGGVSRGGFGSSGHAAGGGGE
jgi:hypothetical protein